MSFFFSKKELSAVLDSMAPLPTFFQMKYLAMPGHAAAIFLRSPCPAFFASLFF